MRTGSGRIEMPPRALAEACRTPMGTVITAARATMRRSRFPDTYVALTNRRFHSIVRTADRSWTNRPMPRARCSTMTDCSPATLAILAADPLAGSSSPGAIEWTPIRAGSAAWKLATNARAMARSRACDPPDEEAARKSSSDRSGASPSIRPSTRSIAFQ
jgi:hypothetical protein